MKQKNILILLVLTFVTVAVWIGTNIYHIIVTSTVDEELQEQIVPINPNFDDATIQKLKNRINAEPLYEYRQIASPVPSPDQENGQTTPAQSDQPTETAEGGTAVLPQDESLSPTPEIQPQTTSTP